MKGLDEAATQDPHKTGQNDEFRVKSLDSLDVGLLGFLGEIAAVALRVDVDSGDFELLAQSQDFGIFDVANDGRRFRHPQLLFRFSF